MRKALEAAFALTAAIGAGGRAVAVKSSLAEELAERHKRQMLDTEHEAFQAAQAGDKARQSIASAESERHRAVYHAMRLILEDQRKLEDAIPRAANAGRYLAEVNDGRLLYLNHANTWQECPNFLSALSQPHPADERVVEALRIVRPEIKSATEILKRLADGDEIAFSEDGDEAFFTKGDRAFVGSVIVSMRSNGYLKRIVLNDENYRGTAERDVISDAGLAALSATEGRKNG
jgi:hypothetical protein